MTLKELANALGYSTHGYFSLIENNRKVPTAELVLKIARYFEVSTDALMRDELSLD